MGVARISTASAIAVAAMDRTAQIAKELRASGCFDALAATLTYAQLQKLFA
jgi:hypothetical protein